MYAPRMHLCKPVLASADTSNSIYIALLCLSSLLCVLLQRIVIPLSALLSRGWAVCSMGEVLGLLLRSVLGGFGVPDACPFKYAFEWTEEVAGVSQWV
jgi:hypothetical protein